MARTARRSGSSWGRRSADRAFVLLAALALFSARGAAAPRGPVDPPGAEVPITVILLDDVDWPTWETADKPHIDALAASGITFTQAWGYPLCSPARAALFTGRHAFRTGIGRNLEKDETSDALALSEVTIAELLAGQATDLFGKWHLGHTLTDPGDQGFRRYAGAPNNLNALWWDSSYFAWLEQRDGTRRRAAGYITDATTDDAVTSDAPNLFVTYHAIHGPIHNPPGGTAQDMLGKQREMLSYVDRAIGRLLAARPGGYVFLLNDNNNASTGYGKGTVLEGGVHVQFLVAGPGIAPRVCDDLVSIVDVFPTLAELRDVPVPHEIDGISLVPILRGLPGVRALNYVERAYEPNNSFSGDPTKVARAIRDRDHKLVVHGPEGWTKLYRMPDEVEVPPPWLGADLVAAARLRSQLPAR